MDKAGIGLRDIPVGISSWRWKFEFISVDPILGLPGPGKGWQWTSKGGEDLGLGETNGLGLVDLKNVSVKAKGNFPGESPAGVQFSGGQILAPLCPDGRQSRGAYVKLNLKTTKSVPDKTNPVTNFPANTKWDDKCILTIGANEDTYDNIVLECKSDKSAAEIQLGINAYLAGCPK